MMIIIIKRQFIRCRNMSVTTRCPVYVSDDRVMLERDGVSVSVAYVHNVVDDCAPVSSVTSIRHLRSADARKLVVRRTIRTLLRARDFAVFSAVVWNSLPAAF